MRLASEVRGDGPPTLLLHGLGLCWQAWEPLFPHLPDLRIHAVDLPGFGATPALAAVSVTGLLDAVERHLDAEGLHTVHVVGNSLGGLLAVGLAARGRARTVTAFSPGGMAFGLDRLRVRTSLLLMHALARAGLPVIPSVMANPVGRYLTMRVGTSARPHAMATSHARTLVGSFARSGAVRQTLDALDAPGGKLLPYLALVDVPVTIAWGMRDLLLPPRQGVHIKRTHPSVRLVRLPDCGHVPMTDDPALVASVIRGTIRSADRSS